MKKILPLSCLLGCCFSANAISEVFFDESFETGTSPFSFSSDNISESPDAFTGERVYSSSERGYVWRNTFHRGCNDTYFGHRVSEDNSWDVNITNTFHWRAYVKFGDSDNSPEWASSVPISSNCPAELDGLRTYELKFPDVGCCTGSDQGPNIRRIIGKFRPNDGDAGYQGVFMLGTPDGDKSVDPDIRHNHRHTDQGAAPFVSNRWYAVEFMVEDNGERDTVKIWINNNDPNNPDYSYTSNTSMFDSSGWTGMRWDHGYRNSDVPRETNFYYDSIVISDSFIGLDENHQDPVTDQNDDSYVIANSALTSASIVSLVDNNTITAGDLSLDLDLYERGTLAPLSPGMIVSGTGPFDVGSNIDGTDMPAHASMLGTVFAMPHNRYRHTYLMVSPNGDASVSIDINGAHYQTELPRGEVIAFDAGEANRDFGAVIRSDLPILLSHIGRESSENRDVSPVPPAATELWGIRTANASITAVEDDTRVTLYASSGSATRTITVDAGERYYINVGESGTSAHQGAGSAVHLVADKPINAMQYADSDGTEQTSFYPTHMLHERFGIPVDSQYIAIACSEADTSVTLYRPNEDPVTGQCSADGNYPGKLFFGQSTNGVNIRQGSYLESTKPIYMMYEASDRSDEHNLMGTSSQP
jgi:hypothetical protein